MNREQIRAIVENRFYGLGAERVELAPSGICWTLYGEFFKVTTLKDFWVLEWTDNCSYAENGCFEDVDPMPYDISEQEILEYIDGVLRR